MIRGTNRRRNGRNNKTISNRNLHAFEKHVERALLALPHALVPPIHCPRIKGELQVNRVISVHLYYTNVTPGTPQPNDYLVYGTVSEPSKYFAKARAAGGDQPLKAYLGFGLTLREIGRMCTSSAFTGNMLKNNETGTQGVIDVTTFSYFQSLQLVKVMAWGPQTASSFMGASVELRVSKALCKGVGATDSRTQYTSTIQEGDRTVRSRVGYGIPNPVSFQFSSGDVAGGINFRAIEIQIGDLGQALPALPATSSELVGVLHLTFRGTVCSTASGSFSLDFDDEESISVLSYPEGNELPFESPRAANPARYRQRRN